MVKITLGNGAISEFEGDAIVSFCDTDISYAKNNPILQLLKYPNQEGYKNLVKSKLFASEKEGKNKLLKELSAIGYVSIGNAIITKAYDFNVKNFIFIPFIDHDEEGNHITSVLLHQALRSAFTLATLYGLKTLAIPALRIRVPKQELMDRMMSIFDNKPRKALTDDEIFNIVITISKEFDKQSLEEVIVYR